MLQVAGCAGLADVNVGGVRDLPFQQRIRPLLQATRQATGKRLQIPDNLRTSVSVCSIS